MVAALSNLLAHLRAAGLPLPRMERVIGLGMASRPLPKTGCSAGHVNQERTLFSSRSPLMARFSRLQTRAFTLSHRTERSDGNTVCPNPDTLRAESRLAMTEVFTSQRKLIPILL